MLLGSSWQLVGSDKPSAAQRGGRHLLDKHPDIKLGYSDIAQRVNILDSGGRRVDGDGSWDGDLDVLLGSDGTMAVLAPCAALAAQRGRRGRHAEDEQRALTRLRA